MRAGEFDKLLKFFYENKSRLVTIASWIATVSTVILCLVYAAKTITAAHDDHDDYNGSPCRYEKNGEPYWQSQGYRPPNQIGVCNSTGTLVRSIDPDLYASVLKIGIPIAFSPFLLVLLNGGVLGFRVAARRGITSVKTSAVSKAIDATTRRKLAEARSAKMERKLEDTQAELDRLLKS